MAPHAAARGYWNHLTQAEYNALPNRQTAELVMGDVYKDPDNPRHVFLYLGPSEHCLPRTHGVDAMPSWACWTLKLVA